jgi:hypothetical protein
MAYFDTATYPVPLAFAFLGAGVLGAELSDPSLVRTQVSTVRWGTVTESILVVLFGGDLDTADVLLES